MIFRDSKKRWWFRTVRLTCLGAAIFAGWIWGGWRQPTTEEMNRLCLEAARKHQWATLQEQGERWAASEPKNGKAWMYVAQAMEQQQKFDEAAKCLTRIPASAPEADSAQIARMELAFGPRNRAEDGAIICEAILEQNPQSKVAQQRLIFFLAMSAAAAPFAETDSRSDSIWVGTPRSLRLSLLRRFPPLFQWSILERPMAAGRPAVGVV